MTSETLRLLLCLYALAFAGAAGLAWSVAR